MHRIWLKKAKEVGLLATVPANELKRAVVAAWSEVSKRTGVQPMRTKVFYVTAIAEVRKQLEAKLRRKYV